MAEPQAKKARFAGGNKRKQHYVNKTYRHRPNLVKGMRGFLITTDGRDMDAAREATHLLEELVGPEACRLPVQDKSVDEAKEDKAKEGQAEDDVETELAKECAELRETKTSPYRFVILNTPVAALKFIQETSTDESRTPGDLCTDLYSKISKDKSVDSRHVQRMVPVHFTTDVRDGFDALAEQLTTALNQYAGSNSPATFAVDFKARHSNVLKRDDVIKGAAEIVNSVLPLTRVSFKDPDLSILVNVVQNVACVGLCGQYEKWKRGNLRLIAEAESST